VLCRTFGPIDSLRVEDVDSPRPGRQQLRVAVEAAGVNFPDTLIVQGLYQFEPPFPFAPGGEIAGRVLEVGEEVAGFAEGDRVMATIGWGGFAEEVVVDAAQAFALPEDMPSVVAGAFLLTYATSLHALVDRGRLRAGETLAVLGAAGGAGLSAVELGKALGARVIACASSEEKLALCRAHGADATIDYTKEDLKAALRQKTDGEGVDVIYDPVGGDRAEPALRAIAWEGRYLVVGFASGEIPKMPLNLALLKGCEIVGVFWGAFAARRPERFTRHVEELLGLYAAGELRPHVEATYPLERATEALEAISARAAKGKLVITPGG
jgi:NADPH2:quinone reductase